MKKCRKLKIKQRRMDAQRRSDHQKKIWINTNSPKEKWKSKVNTELVHYPDYPQKYEIPNLPLPIGLSWELKLLESRMFGQIEEFLPMAKLEIMTQTQYAIMAGGVVKNLTELQMTDEIWRRGLSFAELTETKEFGHPFNILVAQNYRIHLEALRLITGKSLMNILWLGEISVHNDLYDTGDMDFYRGVCHQILEKLKLNPEIDLTTLTLKDLEASSV